MRRALISVLGLTLATAAGAQEYSDSVERIVQTYHDTYAEQSQLRGIHDPDTALLESVSELSDFRSPQAVYATLASSNASSQLQEVYEIYAKELEKPNLESGPELLNLSATSENWFIRFVSHRQLAYLHLAKSDDIKAYEHANLSLKSIPREDTSARANKARFYTWSLLSALHSTGRDTAMSLLATERMVEYSKKAGISPPPSDIFYNAVAVLGQMGHFEDAERLLQLYAEVVSGHGTQERALYHHASGRLRSSAKSHLQALQSYRAAYDLVDDAFFSGTISAQIAAEAVKIGDTELAEQYLERGQIVSNSKTFKAALHAVKASKGEHREAYEILRELYEWRISSLESKLSTAARTAREAMSVNAEVVDARLAEQAAEAEAAVMEKRLAEERARRNRIVALLASLLALVSIASAVYIYRLLKEEKRLRAEADVLSHQAQAASRAKQQFISMMSHEFRTPLNHIIPIVDAYMRHTVDDPKGYTLGKIIDNASHRILRMIDEINTIAGGVEMLRDNIEPFEASRFAEMLESEKRKGYVLRSSLQIHFDYAPDLPSHFAADPDKIERILVALVENSMKFAGDEPVTVGMSFEPPKVWGERGWLVLGVTDTGGGMPQDMIERIMQPFTQGDMGMTRAQDGLGLGMNLVSILTRSLGGRFSVDGNHYSGGRRGTKVTVRIPAFASNAEGTWEAKPESADARKVREAVEAKVNAHLGLRPQKAA